VNGLALGILLNKMNYYITFLDKNYLPHAEKLFEILNIYSKHKIIVFTINFDYETKFDNVVPIYYGTKDLTFIEKMFFKPNLIKKTLELYPNDQFCFVDADIIPLPNCDDIFENFQDVHYPLFVRQCHDYVNIHNAHPKFEKNILEYLGSDISKRSSVYRQTCVFLFNYKCFNFVKEWVSLSNDLHILNNYKYYAAIYDETLANALLWKNEYNNNLGRMHIDFPNFKNKNIFEFLSLINRPTENELLYDDFTRIPNVNDFVKIKFLHGKINDKQFDIFKAFLRYIS
jgi:hypothetical protein